MSFPAPAPTGMTVHNVPNPRDFEEFEGPLIQLAQRSKGDLSKLLTAFFGFLHRRTDFYCVYDDNDNNSNATDRPKAMGFKQGDAERLLLAAFRQFPLRKIPSSTTTTTASQQAQNKQQSTQPNIRPTIGPQSDTSMESICNTDNTKVLAKSSNNNNNPRFTEEGKQIPVGNGGTTNRYTWTQTLEECTLLVAIPPNMRAKDLLVELKATHLIVRSKLPINKDGTNCTINDRTETDAIPHTTFVDGTLFARIVPDESSWTLEGGVLVVVLYKHVKTFWETILVGDPTIDTSLVDSSRHISSYDEATQGEIRRIMFDQQQLSLGKPTSEILTGTKMVVPPLPNGVEFIDPETLDSKTKPV